MADEQTFLKGLKNRTEESYRELVDRYSDRLYRAISRFVSNPEEAKEVLQTTFLKVLENIQSFEGTSALYTWIYRIAVNESLMLLRSRKGKESVSLETVGTEYEDGIRTEQVADWSKLPDESLVDRELQEFVKLCVQQLPEELQTAYVLKDVEQLPEDEVCRILEISKPAMKNRVHRARLFLRKRIEERYVS